MSRNYIPFVGSDWLRQKYSVEGLGCPDIARIVSCDPKTVYKWLKDHGIPTRPRGADTRQHFKPGAQLRLGVKHTPETIAKVRAATLADGRVPYLRNGVHHLKGRRGAAIHNWKGGITPERQTFNRSDAWLQACLTVWQRDNATCQRCGKLAGSVPRRKGDFHVHHRTSFAVKELRAEPANLVLLCAECHYWVHSKANVEGAFLKETHDSRVTDENSAALLFDFAALQTEEVA